MNLIVLGIFSFSQQGKHFLSSILLFLSRVQATEEPNQTILFTGLIQ